MPRNNPIEQDIEFADGALTGIVSAYFGSTPHMGDDYDSIKVAGVSANSDDLAAFVKFVADEAEDNDLWDELVSAMLKQCTITRRVKLPEEI